MTGRAAGLVACVVGAAVLAAEVKDAPDPDALRKEFLSLVAESDRATASAQSAVLAAAAAARRLFEKAEALASEEGRQREPEADPAVEVGRGVTALWEGLKACERHLAAGEKSLAEAEEVRAALDRALDERSKKTADEIAAADRDIDSLRRRVAEQWGHYRSPRLAYRPEALRSARVSLESLVTIAAAAWHNRDVKKAEMKLTTERRRQLAAAGRIAAARSRDLRALRDQAAEFRAYLANPLDGRRPRVSLDNAAEWPPPIRAGLDGLAEEFEPPKPVPLPREWSLEDRIKRFVGGGAP